MGLYIASDYISGLIGFAARSGVATAELLQAPTMPTVLTGLVPWSAAKTLLAGLEQKLPPDRAALAFGLELGITQHGLLGYAAKSARSALEGLLLDEQFMATRTNLLRFRVMVNDEELNVMMDLALRPGEPGWRFVHLAILGSMARMYQDLHAGQSLKAVFTVPFAVPAKDARDLPGLAAVKWREEPGAFRMTGPLDSLLVNLPTGDEILKGLLVEQCRSAMPSEAAGEDLVSSVRGLLRNQLVDPPSVGSLSRQLNLSERTLKRYLQEAGTSYRSLLTELRLEVALCYLQTTPLTIDEVAFRMGYASPSTFKNKFKQWSGMTPGRAREK
ncbi:helix-turn-helix transcriptional regulator [Pseudomonas aeruginosa]|uniref:helix-turn-helix transcriptional regulator n=3 Tax=Pseudomonas aeruginosa TaxID=287 RepID=UPI00163CBF5A|nr:AraC family transcriptional regulator [Pseudomonas aeruginosa]